MNNIKILLSALLISSTSFAFGQFGVVGSDDSPIIGKSSASNSYITY
jgi:hypothetical protein